MSSYESLAGAYDALTGDVGYRRRAEWLDRQFRKQRQPIGTVLDIGCGTGTIACLLAGMGYRVTAVDASEEMLTMAQQKAASLTGEPPFFVCQKMQCLRLPCAADAAVSTLDALNYLTREQDVRETFRRVFRFLQPGGLFVFDVNSPYKLRRMDGQVWLDETETDYCVWRTDFSRRTQLCTYCVDLFRQNRDGSWTRSQELHRERAWEPEDLRRWLEEAGFARVRISGDLTERPPRPDEDRLIFRCVRK